MSLFIDLIHTYFIHAICLGPHFVTLFCSVSFTLLGRISFLFWCFYTSFAGSVGVGVKRDRIPKGDSLSPSQGEAIKTKPPNDECRLLPSSSGWSLWAVVGLSHRHNHFWAGVPHWEPTRLSWKGSDNETLCGQQRHLPLLLVTLEVFMRNSQPQIQYVESEFGQWCSWLANYRHGRGEKVVYFREYALLVHMELQFNTSH